MTRRYDRKFIIYNKQKIRQNYDNLVFELGNFDAEAIPNDFLEVLMEESELFKNQRTDFYSHNKSKMCTIEELLKIDEEINIETDKVLGFITRYPQYKELIVGIDYFYGEDEHIKPFYPTSVYHDDTIIDLVLENIPKNIRRLMFEYFIDINMNELNIYLNNIEREELIGY